MTALLKMEQVTAHLAGKPVLEVLNLQVQPGELVALCGLNGAGKSSALKAALGLLPISSGRALLNGDDLVQLSARKRGQRVAYLPQDRHIAWNMPAIEVIALGAPFLRGQKILRRAQMIMDDLEVGHLADRGVAEMSGGERARVLLARALLVDAPLLLADEPVAGLDPDAQLLVLEHLKARSRSGRGVLVSLHDLGLVAQYADRVVVLDQGRLVAEGRPHTALSERVLSDVFRLNARWMDTDDGPVLAARRRI